MQLEINNKFFTQWSELSKTAIKVYLALCYHSSIKNKKIFEVSQCDIRIILIDDKIAGIGNDYNAYLKAVKQLEEQKLIRVYRDKTDKGKPLTNRYKIL